MAPIFLILVFAISSATAGTFPTRYRDYEYNKRSQSFYKLHTTPRYFYVAQKACAIEGATPLIPSTQDDITQMHSMLKNAPNIGNLVFVGNDGHRPASAEETPILDLKPSSSEEERMRTPNHCEVATRDMEILSASCFDTHPFICKVQAKDIPYDPICKVYRAGYKYFPTVHSCYYVPSLPLTWNEAYSECRAQGAHLVVINSAAESQVLKEFLKSAPAIANARTTYFYFAGIRAKRPAKHQTGENNREWLTVLNETLTEAGFNEWSDGEPNNYNNDEYCGTVFSNNGKYNDVSCKAEFGFICEKEVP